LQGFLFLVPALAGDRNVGRRRGGFPGKCGAILTDKQQKTTFMVANVFQGEAS
jgi:hypothetical protein